MHAVLVAEKEVSELEEVSGKELGEKVKKNLRGAE